MEILNYINNNIYEFFGVLFSFIYVVLSIRQNILCWPILIIASILNMIAYTKIGVPLQAIMQFFFIGTAIYGWKNWGSSVEKNLKIHRLNLTYNLTYVSLGLIISIILTLILHNSHVSSILYSTYPFWDSLMFMFNIIPMYMMGKKILESWIYFIIIDILSGFFWLSTNEYFYCILFFGYIPFAFVGYYNWRKNISNA